MAGVVSALIIAWMILILAVEQVRFAVLAPRAQGGVEAAAALARLFAALVLFLFPTDNGGQRLRWVAGGFVVLGCGGLAFGYLPSLLGVTPDLNTSMYSSLVVRSVAGMLFVVGVVPSNPPPFSRRSLLIALSVLGVLGVLVVVGRDLMPVLAHVTSLEAAAARGGVILPGLTVWHWALSALPLALAMAAVVGVARHGRSAMLGGWLLLAMVLLTGSQLHNIFWPSIYSPVLTTADLLRLAFTAAVVVGGIVELRRIAAERAVLLAIEQEHSRSLVELAHLKAEFMAMVAHELGSPIAAIRNLAVLSASGKLDAAEQSQALATIQAETDVLSNLVADVRAAGAVERADFHVAVRPVPVRALLHDAAAFARILPGHHPLSLCIQTQEVVWADPERIGQVLRNLLANAVKYTPDGTPVELRAVPISGRVRIEVADRGPGIHPDDLTCIFEKFGRGRDALARKVSGVGLGLYLSRRIVQAHGSDLKAESVLGAGSVFAFELGVVR